MTERKLRSFTFGEYTIEVPIFGGAMSIGVAGAEYAAAIANLGGAGTIGGVGRGFLRSNRHLARGFKEADCIALKNEIDLAREMSPHGVLGVNILMAARWHEPLVRTAVGPPGKKSKIDFLVVGAGFHGNLPDWVADHPEVAIVLMTSSDRGTMMAANWFNNERFKGYLPKAMIVEAPKDAGGHLGAREDMIDKKVVSLEYVIPSLQQKIIERGWNIPIIGAGGVWDRADIDRVIALGAGAVQMATRFVCTPECAAPMAFKKKYLEANKEDIVLVDSPVGYPGRAIRNKFVRELEAGEIHDTCKVSCLTKCLCRENGTTFCIIDRLVMAFEGDAENGLVFCGSNAWRSKEKGIQSIAQIFEELKGLAA